MARSWQKPRSMKRPGSKTREHFQTVVMLSPLLGQGKTRTAKTSLDLATWKSLESSLNVAASTSNPAPTAQPRKLTPGPNSLLFPERLWFRLCLLPRG